MLIKVDSGDKVAFYSCANVSKCAVRNAFPFIFYILASLQFCFSPKSSSSIQSRVVHRPNSQRHTQRQSSTYQFPHLRNTITNTYIRTCSLKDCDVYKLPNHDQYQSKYVARPAIPNITKLIRCLKHLDDNSESKYAYSIYTYV